MLATAVDRPLKSASMNRKEAEEITRDIKNNFESLGAMLMEARDRKAYKALDYSSFEQYCKHEFGKSVSRAYQLIEDCKIRERLSAKLSEDLQEDIQISIPSSHLQPLKKLEDVDLQIQAIERAQKIAQAQSTKATKQHLELAVYEVSGQKSEDFRKAIEALGFKKGVEVEDIDTEDRGFVRRIEKNGKIQVQFHNRGAGFSPCNSQGLRILKANEKPRIPANEFSAKNGSLVKIFSAFLKNKTGKILEYISPTHTKVEVEGEKFTLPFAELEVFEATPIVTPKNEWESAIWNDGKATYIYDQSTKYISCRSWPAGLILKPYREEEFDSPMDFFYWWKEHEGSRSSKQSTTTETPKALALLNTQLEEAKNAIEQMVAALRPTETELPTENSNIDSEQPQPDKGFTPEIIDRIQQEREKLTIQLNCCGKELFLATKRNDKNVLEKKIVNLKRKLEDFEKFQSFQIGQRVRQKLFPDRMGTTTGFTITQGGMPLVWVKWDEQNSPITETLGVLVLTER
jgi:hypothetical protein